MATYRVRYSGKIWASGYLDIEAESVEAAIAKADATDVDEWEPDDMSGDPAFDIAMMDVSTDDGNIVWRRKPNDD
jgi:hypothetical protein